MKLSWLKDILIEEISYVDKPATGKRFIAIKMIQEDIRGQKPYPNEHSARLKSPNDFDSDTFRRKADGTIYGSKKVPSTVDVIWGKLKSANKPADYPIPQALHFPTSSWTADKAKKWLKDNNIDYISFEAASKNIEEDTPEIKADTSDLKPKTFIDRMKDKFSGIKIGRVLNKANEDSLFSVADNLMKASEIIKSVLASVNKNYNEEVIDVDEAKVLELLETKMSEKLIAFLTSLEEKFEAKKIEVPEDKKEEDKKPSVDEIIATKFVELKTEIKTMISDELHKKPEPDKIEVNIKEEKKEEKDTSDFTGVFGFNL